MTLPRPLLVLSGWRSWPVMAWHLARDIRVQLDVSPDQIAWRSFATVSSFDAAVRRTMQLVTATWPSDDPDWSCEVDVVGVSMGGIIARAAAAGTTHHGHRLRIRRLFTLASPHRGARLAKHIAIDAAARDMRPGSPFLRRLDEALEHADYELICYARLGDQWVGATNTAPPGMDPIWVKPQGLTMSHLMVSNDARIVEDICRRLVGSEPLLGPPSQPPRD
ncbi:MAG: hypothetical protein AAFX05_05575 [Planctomycetota bacterium]